MLALHCPLHSQVLKENDEAILLTDNKNQPDSEYSDKGCTSKPSDQVSGSPKTTFENKSLIKYDDGRKVDKSGNTRYIKNFESSTVEYETFTYDENDVIRLDEKLHQFINHLKTADPKVESSMAALDEAKTCVRDSHHQESDIRTEINKDYVKHLKYNSPMCDNSSHREENNVPPDEL